MTINDVNNGAKYSPTCYPTKGYFKKPEVTAPSKGGDVRDSAEVMSKAADQRKSQSLNEIAEMAAEIREAVAAINEAAVKKVPTSLDFSVDEASKRFVVQVTDKNTES